jgi:hypothetical protein
MTAWSEYQYPGGSAVECALSTARAYRQLAK